MITYIQNHSLRLNLTSSLAKSVQLLQTGLYNNYTWDYIIQIFDGYFNNNISDQKDTYGFNFGDFQKYDLKSWRLKLYKYYLDIEEKLSNSSNSPRNKKNKFKWEKVNTEQKRIELINSLTSGNHEYSFHRVSKDIINRQAIVIDYDNSSYLAAGLTKVNHSLDYITPDEIINILKKINCSYFAYSSFNNYVTENKPKFRIIIPTNRPYTDKENKILREYILNKFTVRNHNDFIYGLVDITSFEMSRFFYIPVSTENNKNKWFLPFNNSHYLDVDQVLKYQNHQHNFNKILSWKKLIDKRKEIIANNVK